MDTPELLSVLFEMKKFAQEQGAPLRYLINTCRTIEHDLGNSLVDENLITICHENWAASEDHGFTNWNNDHPIRMLFVDRYEKSVDMVRAAIEKYSPEMMPDIPNAEEYMNTKSPDITFTENMTLFVGETNFQIYHTPGHCQGQLCVYIPKERVAIVGDFMAADYMVRMGNTSIENYLEALDFFETLDVDWIIPTRGAAMKKEQIQQQRIAIFKWLSVVAEAIERGFTFQQCMDSISFSEKSLLMDIAPKRHENIQSGIAVACYDYVSGRRLEKNLELTNQKFRYDFMYNQIQKKERERFEVTDD